MYVVERRMQIDAEQAEQEQPTASVLASALESSDQAGAEARAAARPAPANRNGTTADRPGLHGPSAKAWPAPQSHGVRRASRPAQSSPPAAVCPHRSFLPLAMSDFDQPASRLHTINHPPCTTTDLLLLYYSPPTALLPSSRPPVLSPPRLSLFPFSFHVS